MLIQCLGLLVFFCILYSSMALGKTGFDRLWRMRQAIGFFPCVHNESIHYRDDVPPLHRSRQERPKMKISLRRLGVCQCGVNIAR